MVVVITVNVWWCLEKAIQRVQSKKRKKPWERERAVYLYALGRDKKLEKKRKEKKEKINFLFLIICEKGVLVFKYYVT